jgi:hypothetical protein
MNTILVSYDLHAPGKDYSKLKEHLNSYGSWAKPLESLWLVRTTFTAEQVRDAAKKHVDQNDKIFAVDITGKASAWNNLPDDVSNWIKANWNY